MRPTLIARALVAVAALGLGLAQPAAAEPHGSGDPALVRTDKGAVRGTVTQDYREFQGIPYAAPPVGPLRWASPRPTQPWRDTRAATRPGNGCAQIELHPYLHSESEDCLYLNVTTPRRAEHRRLPVLVFFHGGGFSAGSSHETLPTELAARGDVVAVTVNYRLGALGFLAHPALDGGEARQRSGNFGLEDQQEALRWVRRNAAAFGGDPGNVTISGQWSGGKAVCVQMTSPSAAGLFHKVITMSNPCTLHTVPRGDGSPDPEPLGLPRSRAAAERHGLALAADVGCADPATAAACLRAVPAMDLLKKAPFLTFTPVYGGGGVLPVDPLTAFETGRFHKVPVLLGTNRDAYRTSDAYLELWGYPKLTPEGYVLRVRNFVGAANAERVLARYPLRDYQNIPSLAWSALATDALLSRPQSDTAALFARHVPTYAYEFADRDAPWYGDLALPSFPTGAYQDAELQYLFTTVYFAGRAFTPAQRALSNTMIDYVSRFAHRGDPNGRGLPHWPSANRDAALAQVLEPGAVRPGNFRVGHSYDFWRSIDY
ncbi:carboxylesterase/lipase family protein [Actinokineospora diospyrosa]|uniref:Para-nitrobenzyl esterase n=1 Tax=Actinokineospora diospyrosa TaxID=103728 RepID=A0ABT1IED6_9PSEU|nr:carboxylesterase family protein [Actinokineospora diospyrosa]MCP2270948.1 para-nitrobenzyl esterase [Actinokineospora diospyrosa]